MELIGWPDIADQTQMNKDRNCARPMFERIQGVISSFIGDLDELIGENVHHDGIINPCD